MANSYFRFKQFTVWHDKCAMKVGTDGVLLGAWVKVEKAKNILDIGTGTGLVALMLAQRSFAFITAIDVDNEAVEQARENIDRSSWAERIKVLNEDIKQYNPDAKFDVIVSNPPYFKDSLKSPDKQRTLARHTEQLSYSDLIKKSASLLNEKGELSLIVPADVVDSIIEIAYRNHLFPCRQLSVLTKPNSLPKRVLITFCTDKDVKLCIKEMLIEKSRHVYSDEYIALTKTYYLNM